MGVFDFIKSGIGEMLIHRPDDKKGLVIYKHPDGTIPNYAQLTVDADEAAVFFRDGSVVGTLKTAGAGQRHTLSTQNIPFLTRIADGVTKEAIFTTDLYFVTTKTMFDQKFGGPLGFIEDPTLGEMVQPRIFGKYSFQIIDPARFILGYTGLGGQLSNDAVLSWVKERLLNTVKTTIGQVMITEQVSFLQLMPKQAEIAKRLADNAPDLSAIGIKLHEVADFNINLSDEDTQTLKDAQSEIGSAKRAVRVAQIGVAQAQAEAAQKQHDLDQQFEHDKRYVGMAGGDFSKMAAGRAMLGAAQGMASGEGGGGGGMTEAAGLGAGFAMAQAMTGAMSAPSPQVQANHGQAVAGAEGKVQCGACGSSVNPGKFCMECGANLSPKPKFCPSCGNEASAASKFCSHCGTNIA